MNRAVRRKQGKQPSTRRERRAAARPDVAAPRPGKSPEKASGGGSFLRAPRFLMDIINELRKVVWPTRDDVIYLTIVVVIITILFGAVLGAIDFGFGYLIDKTILQ